MTIAEAEALGRGLTTGVDDAVADGVALAETEGEEVGLGLAEGVF
jgi:hypothetical protein